MVVRNSEPSWEIFPLSQNFNNFVKSSTSLWLALFSSWNPSLQRFLTKSPIILNWSTTSTINKTPTQHQNTLLTTWQSVTDISQWVTTTVPQLQPVCYWYKPSDSWLAGSWRPYTGKHGPVTVYIVVSTVGVPRQGSGPPHCYRPLT